MYFFDVDLPNLKIVIFQFANSSFTFGARVKSNLVGGFNPSEKYESQSGLLFPTEWKVIHSCSSHHQTDHYNIPSPLLVYILWKPLLTITYFKCSSHLHQLCKLGHHLVTKGYLKPTNPRWCRKTNNSKRRSKARCSQQKSLASTQRP